MKKVVLISALLGAFAANVFTAKTHKKTKEQTPAQ
ncbi:TPA: hypothetical protein ACYKE3_000734 [Campylobacter jejuni]